MKSINYLYIKILQRIKPTTEFSIIHSMTKWPFGQTDRFYISTDYNRCPISNIKLRYQVNLDNKIQGA